jgi:hypothetical protein
MDSDCSSETLVPTSQTKWCYVPEVHDMSHNLSVQSEQDHARDQCEWHMNTEIHVHTSINTESYKNVPDNIVISIDTTWYTFGLLSILIGKVFVLDPHGFCV